MQPYPMMDDRSPAASRDVSIGEEHLKPEVLRGLRQTSPDKYYKILQDLGTKSRDCQDDFRIELFRNGIFGFLLDGLDPQASEKHALEILRIISNCCADVEETREHVLTQYDRVAACLKYPTLASNAVIALFNICNDNEVAQQQVANPELFQSLCKVVSSNPTPLKELAFGPAVELIQWISDQISASTLTAHGQIEAVHRIASTAMTCEDADFEVVVIACLNFLRDTSFREKVLEHDLFNLILDLFHETHDRALKKDASNDAESDKTLAHLQRSLSIALTEISSLEQFPISVPIDSNVVRRLLEWVLSDHVDRSICGCILLGNLAVNDNASIAIAERLDLPQVISLLTNPDKNLLFAAACFLRHLAIPSKNKGPLGETGIIEASHRGLILAKEDALKIACVRLLRQVIIGSKENLDRLLDGNILSNILDFCAKPSLAIEVGRLAVSICRTLKSTTSDQDRLMELTRMPNFVGSIISLVDQDNQMIVAEGRFGLALIASKKEAANQLVEILRGRNRFSIFECPDVNQDSSEPDQPHFLQKSKQNLAFLAAQLLKNAGHSINAEEMRAARSAMCNMGASSLEEYDEVSIR